MSSRQKCPATGPEKRLRSRKQPMTSRWVGRQESSEARGGAVRRSAPPGEGEGTNRHRQTLASPLTPHVRTVGFNLEAEAHAKRGRGKAEAVAISHEGRSSSLQGRRAMQGKYVQRGPPNKSLSREPRPRGVGKGIQDLTEPVGVEHPPQDAQFLPVGTEFLRQPAGGTRGACERRTQDS